MSLNPYFTQILDSLEDACKQIHTQIALGGSMVIEKTYDVQFPHPDIIIQTADALNVHDIDDIILTTSPKTLNTLYFVYPSDDMYVITYDNATPTPFRVMVVKDKEFHNHGVSFPYQTPVKTGLTYYEMITKLGYHAEFPLDNLHYFINNVDSMKEFELWCYRAWSELAKGESATEFLDSDYWFDVDWHRMQDIRDWAHSIYKP